MRKKTEKQFHYILDCFSGADGGASFIALQILVQEMDKRAAKGDQAAEEIIALIRKFAKLIELSEKIQNRVRD